MHSVQQAYTSRAFSRVVGENGHLRYNTKERSAAHGSCCAETAHLLLDTYSHTHTHTQTQTHTHTHTHTKMMKCYVESFYKLARNQIWGVSSPKLWVTQTTNAISQGSSEAELPHNILPTQGLWGSYYPKTQEALQCSPPANRRDEVCGAP